MVLAFINCRVFVFLAFCWKSDCIVALMAAGDAVRRSAIVFLGIFGDKDREQIFLFFFIFLWFVGSGEDGGKGGEV